MLDLDPESLQAKCRDIIVLQPQSTCALAGWIVWGPEPPYTGSHHQQKQPRIKVDLMKVQLAGLL